MKEDKPLEGLRIEEQLDESLPEQALLTPRRTRRYTGEKLGDRIPLVQALVTKGDSFSSIAKQLKISRHSVRGIARRMQQEGYDCPERVEQIRRSIGGQFAVLADRSLRAIKDGKLHQTGAYELTRIAAIAAEKAGLVDAPSNSSIAFIQQNFRMVPSHSASRATIDIPIPNGHGQPSESPDK